MMETRHGLESNSVPTSILSFIDLLGQKMDVGTGLDSRPCLVSIIFADLPSLYTSPFYTLMAKKCIMPGYTDSRPFIVSIGFY